MHASDSVKPLPWRRNLWSGVVVSVLLHTGGLFALLAASLPSLPMPNTLQGEMIVAQAVAADAAAQAIEQPASVTIEPQDVTATMVEAKLSDAIHDAERASPDERIDTLDNMTKRLNGLSDAESLAGVVTAFQSWFGLDERASRPAAAAPAGDFDYETAQLHDMRREVQADGEPVFIAVLLDAAGRILEVQLTAAEGKPAYELMERMKANPLLDQLYRQLAMPMLDQALRGAATPKDQHTAEDRDREDAQPLNGDPF